MPEVSSKDLEIIAIKLDQVQEKQNETGEKVGDIRRGLYEPDSGLFSKVKELRLWSEEHERNDSEMRKVVEETARSWPEAAARISQMEAWKSDHEIQDREIRNHVKTIVENMEPLTFDYKSRMSSKTWRDKIKLAIITVVVTTVMAGAAAAIRQAFVNSDSSASLDRIEKKLEP